MEADHLYCLDMALRPSEAMTNAVRTLIVWRAIALCGFCMGLAAFWYGPDLLALSAPAHLAWNVVAQIGGPLAATGLCFLSALRSVDSDRAAWQSFGAGSLLYLLGNLFYLYCALVGLSPTFPTLPEGAYFAMAMFFARGMSQFGNVSKNISRVQIYNFGLTYCAITVACLFLLHGSIQGSTLGPFGSIVAIMYPALWLSVAAFGIISLFLYDQGGRLFPYVLLLAAVVAEAVGDFVYAGALMKGTYQSGGITQLLWVASAGLTVLAALEGLIRRDFTADKPASRRSGRAFTQATVPAAAIAIIVLSGSVSGAFGRELIYVLFSAALGAIFAVLAGLREHYIIEVQRKLREDLERISADAIESRESLSAVLEATSDSVVVLDREGRIEFFNNNAAQTLCGIGTLALGADLWKTFSVDEDSDFSRQFQSSLQAQPSREFEQFVPQQGIWLSINAYRTSKGNSIFFRDISEQRRVREEIHYLAHHDPLTGTANRALLYQQLELGLSSAESEVRVALLCLDLDDFKGVNDTRGHPAGDALLQQVAARIRTSVNAIDLVARMGGDEFAVLCFGERDLRAVAARILEAIGKPYDVDGEPVLIGGSVGIAVRTGPGESADQLIKAADIALYAAKAEGGGTYRFFEPAMEARLTERQVLKSQLGTALDNSELELVYQPIVDLSMNRVASFEALLRWRHPERGMVSPVDFIPAAEETGLILPIGEWVLMQACLEAAKWPGHVGVAVNLSALQFRDRSLPRIVASALSQAQLSADRLELEITETVLLNDSEANLEVLHELRALGVKVALDDFGTGYSSLSYLRSFPFTKIKIDRLFVGDIEQARESQAIVRAIADLGRSLRIVITAEGIETRQQLDWIQLEGCNQAQGYFFSRPVTPLAVLPLIDKLNANSIWWTKPAVQGGDKPSQWSAGIVLSAAE